MFMGLLSSLSIIGSKNRMFKDAFILKNQSFLVNLIEYLQLFILNLLQWVGDKIML
jgi:hypothetical protein